MASEEEYGLENSSADFKKPSNSAAGAPFAHGTATPEPSQPIVVQPVRKEDLQPSYAHLESVPSNGWYGSFINSIGNCAGALGAIPFCFCCPNPYKSVQQGEVGLVTRFGQFYKAADPGLVKVNPFSEKLVPVEVRIQVMDIPQQVCMTKDNVNIRLSSVMYYHIVSPHKAQFGVSNVNQALMERTQTTLRHVVGARVLQEIIERREEVAASIREIIDETAGSWGVTVESILIKDIILSEELQDSLALAATARRAGESKIITARAEVESAKLMRKAADILASKAAMQIRYLEAMQAMARTANTKVLFMPGQNALENLAAETSNGQPAPPVELSGDSDPFTNPARLTENAAYLEANIN